MTYPSGLVLGRRQLGCIIASPFPRPFSGELMGLGAVFTPPLSQDLSQECMLDFLLLGAWGWLRDQLKRRGLASPWGLGCTLTSHGCP